MILDIIINLSVMFTFIIFSYFVLEYYQEKRPDFSDLRPFIIGVVATGISLVLMQTALNFEKNIFVDTRNISILISGLLGGPAAILLSSILVGFFRMFFFEVNPTSFMAGGTTIVLGFIFFFLSFKKPINYKNSHFYLAIQTIVTAILLFFLEGYKNPLFISIIFVIMNVTGFYLIYFVLKLFKRQFERIRVIEKLSETDYTTDLPNNRKFDSMLERAIKTQQPFSLLLIDIDQFKMLNLRYGHEAGDELLRELAERLKSFSKTHLAFPARISGEEFSLLCYDAAPAVGVHYATELMLMIRDEPFMISNGESVQLSVSIGVASYPDNGETVKELTNAVDEAMNAASVLGRSHVVHLNQVCHKKQSTLKKQNL